MLAYLYLSTYLSLNLPICRPTHLPTYPSVYHEVLDVASGKRPRCAVTQWFQDLAPPMLASAGPGMAATYSAPPEGGVRSGDAAGPSPREQPGRSAAAAAEEVVVVSGGERAQREKAATEARLGEARRAPVAAAVEASPPEVFATLAAVEAEVLEAEVEAAAEVKSEAEADCEKGAFEEEAFEKGGLAEDEDQSRSHRPAVQLPPTTPTPTRARARRATRGARAAAPAAKLPLRTPGHGETVPPGHGELGYGGSELPEPQETSFEIRLRGVT